MYFKMSNIILYGFLNHKHFFPYPFNLFSSDVPFNEQQDGVKEAEENTDHCLDDGNELYYIK